MVGGRAFLSDSFLNTLARWLCHYWVRKRNGGKARPLRKKNRAIWVSFITAQKFRRAICAKFNTRWKNPRPCWIANISILKSCKSIVPTSNRKQFRSILGFGFQSVSSLLWHNQEVIGASCTQKKINRKRGEPITMDSSVIAVLYI